MSPPLPPKNSQPVPAPELLAPRGSSHGPHVPHVHGSAVYKSPAGFGPRLGAGIMDGSLTLALFFVLHRTWRATAIPQAWWAGAIGALFALAWIGQRAGFGRTLGNRAWCLRTERKGWASLSAPLLQPLKTSWARWTYGVFLTVLSGLACAGSINEAVFLQPVWARAQPLELAAYLPDMNAGTWEVLPFFYTLGAWPQIYAGHPIFYSLPYEKGPPKLFVGHLSARWEAPATRVTFEGPKTPQDPITMQAGERTPRENIRHCLLGDTHAWSCLKIREVTLLRHLEDMQIHLTGKSGGQTALAMKWQLRWFMVHNPALPEENQAQGIYLSAQTTGPSAGPGTGHQEYAEGHGEERYILITENGTHQAIWLDYANPGSAEAQLAQQTFAESIRSLRASDDLGPGRAWIDRRLASIKLSELIPPPRAVSVPDLTSEAGPTHAEQLPRLAEAQSLLLASITVQPSVLDAYFLLGGIALQMNRIARAGPQAGHLEGLELAATAKPLIQSAYRYAQDVAPADSRTTLLQGFWLESRKP